MYDDADLRRALLREIENEIADLRAEKVRIEAKLARLEIRQQEIRERATGVAPLGMGLGANHD